MSTTWIKYWLLLFTYSLLPCFTRAQIPALDSLKALFSATKNKKEKLEIYLGIFDKIQLLQLGTKILTLATELDDDGHIIEAHYNIAVGHYYVGEYNIEDRDRRRWCGVGVRQHRPEIYRNRRNGKGEANLFYRTENYDTLEKENLQGSFKMALGSFRARCNS